MKQPDLYYFETIKNDVTSLVKVHKEYSPATPILHIKLTRLVTSLIQRLPKPCLLNMLHGFFFGHAAVVLCRAMDALQAQPSIVDHYAKDGGPGVV